MSGTAALRAGSPAGYPRAIGRRGAVLVPVVGADDARDELMPHDVTLVEVDERDALDVAEDLARHHEPGSRVGEVDLRDISRHDRLRTVAEPGEEHLHLWRRGVLRLVEDDEGLVQRAPAHVRERRDLDLAALLRAGEALGWHEVVERVVERPQVRVDLLLKVAREEPKPLPRLDRRPGEDEPRDASLAERGDAHRDRQERVVVDEPVCDERVRSRHREVIDERGRRRDREDLEEKESAFEQLVEGKEDRAGDLPLVEDADKLGELRVTGSPRATPVICESTMFRASERRFAHRRMQLGADEWDEIDVHVPLRRSDEAALPSDGEADPLGEAFGLGTRDHETVRQMHLPAISPTLDAEASDDAEVQ